VDVVPLSLDSPRDHLQAWHRLGADVWRDELPQVDPVGEKESLADLDSDATAERRGLAALEAGEVVAIAVIQLPLLEDVGDAYVNIVVDRARRRRGVGRQLLEIAREHVRSLGRSRVISDAGLGGPGEAFAAAVGARITQVDVGSVLGMTALDAAELGRVAVCDDDYRLVQWRGACPDELVDLFAHARAAMNDAPQGDEEHDDWEWNATRVRELERRRDKWDVRSYTTAAVDAASGDIAGFTDLLVVDRPSTALQEDTGVLRAHRGHGLGIAMKAANLLALRDREPHIDRVVTWNAEDNRHMRAVNERLGFEVAGRWLDLSMKL
jgi:GNAT superfamily N-acetyltransferase